MWKGFRTVVCGANFLNYQVQCTFNYEHEDKWLGVNLLQRFRIVLFFKRDSEHIKIENLHN